MPTLRLPLPEDDDQKSKRERRSNRRAARKREDLERAAVPDRSCMTCRHWYQTDPQWGECLQAVVVRKRVGKDVVPPDGIEAGIVIARDEPAWWTARSFGQATALQTHRTFVACSRYDRGDARRIERQGPSLVARVRGAA